jgi:hypothetical protein
MPNFNLFSVADGVARQCFGGRAQTFVRRCTRTLCTAGENACPPDDVGGPRGYARFLAAMADPEDEEHSSMETWIGGVFDPRGFDLNRVNRDWHRR